ncbi:PIN domain-containing protein [Candidatus Woesearchaeota archaeon]|nr:PIN domain-containing protein [Candidatus Woesearchaeota archaeon]
MFADTDFMMAMLKDSDWLKQNAVKIFDEHKNNLRTSVSVIIEVALVSKRLGLDTQQAIAHALELAELDELNYAACMRAAVYIGKHGLNVFDAFHAAYCGNDAIVSSDSAYDRLGIGRVKLEEGG